MKRATIVKVDEKTHRVMLGGHEIGVSKTDFDARFHMHAINDALDVAYLEGQQYLERLVANQRLELELMKQQLHVEAELAATYCKITLEDLLKENPKLGQTDGLCCLAAHANATPPWTCSCDCHKGL
jgi:hypothetical protein